MSWNHGTYGWEKFEAFLQGLNLQGVKYAVEELPNPASRRFLCRGTDIGGQDQHLRKATFTIVPAGKRKPRRMLVEEYLAVDDQDCDGASQVAIEVYEEGHRPNLELRTKVLKPR